MKKKNLNDLQDLSKIPSFQINLNFNKIGTEEKDKIFI